MAIFEWVCRECAIYWDRDCPVGKAPNRTKCPKCKKLCDKYWQNANTAISFKDDGCGNANGTGGAMDFHTVKQRYRKFAKEGYDKDSANRFLHRKIKETKERKDNATFYKAMNLDWQKMENDGLAKRLSADESRAKIGSIPLDTPWSIDIVPQGGMVSITALRIPYLLISILILAGRVRAKSSFKYFL